jgi:general L-amino acid transport system permease protein
MSDTHAQTVTFVRDTMLPPVAPPASEAGAVKWMRENLFSSVFNAILTILGLVVLYLLVTASLPWFLNGVWNASSLGECREIVAASAGEGASGACWAMIRERWHQFLFGFYPPQLYWRPILALGLLFAALAPVLFAGQKRNLMLIVAGMAVGTLVLMALAGAPVTAYLFLIVVAAVLLFLSQTSPSMMLLFTALYPALCFWLLWGGTIWLPLGALAGFVILRGVYLATAGMIGRGAAIALSIIAAFAWWLKISGLVTAALSSALPWGLTPVNSDQFGGFLLAITIGVTAIGFSLPIGIILALGRKSDMLIVKTLCVGFIEFIRGVPLITLLFTASLLLQYFLPPNTNFDIILRVIILVTLFASAYLAEVIRGGLAALPRGQYEAADALGLDYWRAQRLIILPQALKISIPGIVSTFIGLFKDTTLVAFVGLMDPLKGVTQIVRADINWKGIYWEPYIFVGAIFFVICFGMSRYSMYLERKLKTDHR